MTPTAAMPYALAETCRVVTGRIPLWPLHRDRLASGGVAESVLAALDAEVMRVAASWDGPPNSRLRLAVRVECDGAFRVTLARRLSSLDVPGGPIPVRVDIDAPPELPPHGAKPADRTPWDAALRAARAERGHQALLTDPNGFVIDGSSASVWVVEAGRLVTPPAPPAIAGVARRFVLERAAAMNLDVGVEPLAWERATGADELFFTNAFGGAVAARDRGGPVSSRIIGLFRDIWAW